jgi:hypothetical protein
MEQIDPALVQGSIWCKPNPDTKQVQQVVKEVDFYKKHVKPSDQTTASRDTALAFVEEQYKRVKSGGFENELWKRLFCDLNDCDYNDPDKPFFK